MSTFDALIEDITRDVHRVQPKDALQYCANWFQARLEEQRTRIRDTLATSALPPDLPSTFISDSLFGGSYQSFSSTARASIPNAHSPFGTLNVPGNALLPSGPPPITFQIDGSPTDPHASHTDGHASDFLQPPTSALGRRTSVSAESIQVNSMSNEALPSFPKTAQQLSRIKAAIAGNFMFRGLSDEQEQQVVGAMQEAHADANEVVIRQGDVGEFFYIVEEGLLYVYIRAEAPPPAAIVPNKSTLPPASWVKDGYHPDFGNKVAEVKGGDFFGELALMYGHARAATVMGIQPSTLWTIDRMTFRTIILKSRYRIRSMYEHFLSTVPLLSSLNADERSKIADALISKEFEDGEAVVREGEMGDDFFFIEAGEAIATKCMIGDSGEPENLIVGHHKKGDYFGELSLLRLAPRAATVSAVHREDKSQPKLKVAALGIAAFTRLLGSLKDIMERNARDVYGSRYSGSRHA